MSFLTTILRRSGNYWVALCLENGVVSQGSTKEEALIKMREAIASLELAFSDDPSLFTAPIAINELHEFLSVEGRDDIRGRSEAGNRIMVIWADPAKSDLRAIHDFIASDSKLIAHFLKQKTPYFIPLE